MAAFFQTERKSTRILLVVAPDVLLIRQTVRAFDILATADGVRFAMRPAALRGWSRATAFVALTRDSWGAAGEELRKVLDILIDRGTLRIAGEDDLAAVRIDPAAIPTSRIQGASHAAPC